MGKIISSSEVHPDALQQMRERGGDWAAYQNLDLSAPNCGHMQFLKIGEDCTYRVPPEQYPRDNEFGPGWRYRHVGMVDLELGRIES